MPDINVTFSDAALSRAVDLYGGLTGSDLRTAFMEDVKQMLSQKKRTKEKQELNYDEE